jgi:hypothetical protein
MNTRKIIAREWTASILAYVMLVPFIAVFDFVASPFRLWRAAGEMTREKLAEIEMRNVVIRAIAQAAQDGSAVLVEQRLGGKKDLVN